MNNSEINLKHLNFVTRFEFHRRLSFFSVTLEEKIHIVGAYCINSFATTSNTSVSPGVSSTSFLFEL